MGLEWLFLQQAEQVGLQINVEKHNQVNWFLQIGY